MALSDDASSYLKEHLDRLGRDGVEVKEVVVADNGTAQSILSQAESDLVVMSTHGRTGFDRAFFGSVADKVVRGASGPVMVIPPQKQRPAGEAAELVAVGAEA